MAAQTLGHAGVVVVAEDIQMGRVIAHELRGFGVVAGELLHAAGGLAGGLADGGITHGAGADVDAVGVVFLQPLLEDLLIPGVVGGGVAMGEAGLLQHVGLVDELGAADGHAVVGAEFEELLCLSGGPGGDGGLIGAVHPGAAGHGNHQLGAYVLYKVQNADPLLPGQGVQVPLGHFAAHGVVQIVVGLGGPGAEHPNPQGAKFLGKLSQLGLIQVDGGIDLHQILVGSCETAAHVYLKGLGARYLAGGVGLPEGAACHLSKFHIVAHHAGVLLPQSLQLLGAKFHKFCHSTLLQNSVDFHPPSV